MIYVESVASKSNFYLISIIWGQVTPLYSRPLSALGSTVRPSMLEIMFSDLKIYRWKIYFYSCYFLDFGQNVTIFRSCPSKRVEKKTIDWILKKKKKKESKDGNNHFTFFISLVKTNRKKQNIYIYIYRHKTNQILEKMYRMISHRSDWPV